MSDVVLLAVDLENGSTIREVCPRCGGGSSKETSLTITRSEDGSLVWNCFRDKCDERGATGSSGTIVSRAPKPKPKKRFEGTTVPLSNIRLKQLRDKWGIVNPPYWYWTSDYGGRVAMSIRSPKYMHRGWVLRDLRGVAKTKALTYIDEGEVPISWYRTTKDAPCVIVEDIPSAVRVSMCGVNAVALLGTHVNLEKAQEIAAYATRIVIALDQDATQKAFQIARKYGLLWDDVQVLPLDRDCKDQSQEELKRTLDRIVI